MEKQNTDKKASVQPENVRKEWYTQKELDAFYPRYFDLRQKAIACNGTFTFCGTNAWFKTSDGGGHEWSRDKFADEAMAQGYHQCLDCYRIEPL